MRSFVDLSTGAEVSAPSPSSAARKLYKGGAAKAIDPEAAPRIVKVKEESSGKIFAYKCSVVKGEPFSRGGMSFSGYSIAVKSV